MPQPRSTLQFADDRVLNLDLHLGDGDWTLEFFFQSPPPGVGQRGGIIGPSGGGRSLAFNPLFAGSRSSPVFNGIRLAVLPQTSNAESVYAYAERARSPIQIASSPGWHHIAFVSEGGPDPGRTRCFLNGVEVATIAARVRGDLAWFGNRIVPGGLASGADLREPGGRFAELRVWNRVLSAEEVYVNATTPRLALPADPSLVAYLPMDDGQGAVVRDRVRNKDCTLSGNTAAGGWVAGETVTITPANIPASLRAAVDAKLRALAVDASRAAAEEAAKARALAIAAARQAAADKKARVRAVELAATEAATERERAAARAAVNLAAYTEVAGHASMSFSGAVALNLDADIPLPTAWTIEAFVRLPLDTRTGWYTLTRGRSRDHHVLIGKEANQGHRLGVYLNAPAPPNGFFSIGYDLDALPAGWHHLTAVGQGGRTTFYVDGAVAGVALAQSSVPIHTIGGYQDWQPFGQTAEVRIWGRALTAAEVALNASLVALTGQEADLLAYFPFTEGSGTQVESKVGGYRGTLSGTPTWTAYASSRWQVQTAALDTATADNVAALTAARAKVLPAHARKNAARAEAKAARALAATALTLTPVVGARSGVQVDLQNADQQPSLYLEQGPQALTLRLVNQGKTPLQVLGGESPSRLELRFRPGALTSTCTPALVGVQEWTPDPSRCTTDGDGTRVVSLMRTGTTASTLSALTLPMSGFEPDPTGGTRASRVQVAWYLTAPDGSAVQGSQQVHLSIVFPTENALRARFALKEADFAASTATLDTLLASRPADLRDAVLGLRTMVKLLNDTVVAEKNAREAIRPASQLFAYVHGDPAVLVSPAQDAGYPNTLKICITNLGEPLALVSGGASKVTLQLGGAEPWTLLGGAAGVAPNIQAQFGTGAAEAVVLDNGRGQWIATAGTWAAHATLTLTISGLVVTGNLGDARVRLDYEGLGGVSAANRGTLWVTVARRNQIEPEIGKTVIRGALALSNGGRLALLSGQYAASTNLVHKPGLSLEGEGVKLDGATGVTVKSGDRALLLTTDSAKLQHSDNKHVAVTATGVELRAGGPTTSLSDAGKLGVQDLEVRGSGTISALKASGMISAENFVLPTPLSARLASRGVVTIGAGVSLPASWTVEGWVEFPLPAEPERNTIVRGAYSAEHLSVRRSDMALGCFASRNFHPSGAGVRDLSGWHHLAVTHTNGDLRFFVDGTSRGNVALRGNMVVGGSVTAVSNPLTEPVNWLGNIRTGGQSCGRIKSWSIWSEVLSDTALASRVSANSTPPAGANLLAHYPLDDLGDIVTGTKGPGGSVTWFADSPTKTTPLVQKGTIAMWSGAANAVPYGWALCDGTNGTPDLRARFVVGAGTVGTQTYNPRDNSGTELTGQRTLTVDQMPRHTHTINDPGHKHSTNFRSASGGNPGWTVREEGGNTPGFKDTSSDVTNIKMAETGASHAIDFRPPWYALCFIMKT